MTRQPNKRGIMVILGRVLLFEFGAIAILSFMATVQAFQAGPDLPAFSLGVFTTGIWTGLALIVGIGQSRPTGLAGVNRRRR